MKFTIPVKTTKEIDIKFLRMEIPVRYGEEDIPNDFPGRTDDVLSLLVDVESREIIGFPKDFCYNVHMKVCDEGSYYLLDANKEELLKLENYYAPNEFVPGSYGDYVELNIVNGVIENWLKNPKIDEFLNLED